MKRYLIASISLIVVLFASFAMQSVIERPEPLPGIQQGPDSLFQVAVRQAEQYLLEKKYDRCLVELEKAEKLKPQEQAVKDKIVKVKGLIAEQQKKLPEYQKYIASGDGYFSKADYLNAKASYQMAIDIFPEDQAARDKLKKTMDLLRSQKAQNTIYDVAVASADKLFQQKEYDKARAEYENASRILPSEKYPKDRINEIVKIQLDIQMKEEGYARAIVNGDKLFNSLKYQQALPEYQTAQKIKPAETYPKERIARLHVILDSLKQLDDAFARAIANGDILFMEEKFQESRKSYVTASEIKPDQVYPRNKIAEIDGILAANKKIDDEFQRYITAADSFYIEKQYVRARDYYYQASRLKPADPYPKEMLNKTAAGMTAQEAASRSLDEQYLNLLTEADKQMASANLPVARQAYADASVIKPEENYPKSRIAEIDRLLQLEAEKKKTEEKYSMLIAEADKQYEQKLYDQARKSFQEAMTMKPDDPYPAGRIAEIDQALKLVADKQAMETKYTGLLKLADQQFNAKSYPSARQSYNEALALKPDEIYPSAKIKSVDSILAEVEKRKMADQEYAALMEDGESYFSAKEFTKARSSFQAALEIRPSDVQANARLKAVDDAVKMLADENARNERYKNLIASGDLLFEAKSYDSARSQYNLASILKSSEIYPKSRIAEIDKILAEIAQSNAMEARYTGLLTDADRLFNERSYEKSKSLYQEALLIKPGEAYPTGKISEIDQALRLLADQKALEEKYRSLIRNADQQFNVKSYAESRQSYTEAGVLKPDEKYPATRIAAIDSIITLQEQLKLADQEFVRLIAEGDNYFSAKSYENAKSSFQNALKIKPNDPSAAAKLKSTESALKALADKIALEEKYALLIRQGDLFFNNNVYDSARAKFAMAAGINPGESYPAGKIAEIDKILADLAKIKATDEKYTTLIASADQLMTSREFEKARVTYQEAQALKPAETYPAGKISEIDTELKMLADQKALDEKYLQTIKAADQQFSAGIYADSRKGYLEAKSLKPSEKYPTERIVAIDSILTEMDRKKMMEQNFADELGKGESAYTAGNYQQAKVSFEAALKIKPGEQRAVARLAETESRLLEIETRKALDDRYTRLITEGDHQLKLLQFDSARMTFSEASDIKPAEEYPRAKIKEIDLELARLAKQKELDEQYQGLIDEADKQFAEKLFDQAKTVYNQALRLKPGSEYPAGKIREADEQLAVIAREKAIEDQFNKIILQSDAQFSQKQYDEAAQGYRKALEIKAGNSYANDKLAEIESIQSELRAREEAYKNAVAKADGLFDSKSYEEARLEYENALIIKPNEQYPRQRIAAANNFLAELKGKQQTYDKLMINADDYLRQKDYQRAKDSYEQALALFPSETLPQQRIQRINTINDSIFRANKGLYDKAIADGDRFFNGYEFDKAIDAYNTAAFLLPMETYPRDMIRKIQRTIAENAVADVLKTTRQITSGNEEKFSFEPVNMASRKNNLIYMKVKNLSGKPFNVLMRYGTGNQANGGVIVRNLSIDGKVNERLISVKEQDAWYRNDNNWISLSPQGGDIEVSFIQVSRSRLE